MLPALPRPEDWPQHVEYTVVLDPVFKLLKYDGIDQNKCRVLEVSPQYQALNVYSWIPENQLVWIVPGTVQYLANFSRCNLKKANYFEELQTRATDEVDEGQCIVAAESHNWYLGYDNGELHYKWKERKQAS